MSSSAHISADVVGLAGPLLPLLGALVNPGYYLHIYGPLLNDAE
jgi:hypothetical protein